MVLITNNETYEFNWSYNDFYLVSEVNKKRNPGYPLDSISIDEKTNKYFVDMTESDRKENDKETSDKEVIEFILNSLKESNLL